MYYGLLVILIINIRHTDPRAELSESCHHLHELGSALTEENTAVHPYLKSINLLLFQAVLTARAQVEPYTINEPVAPGKKNETQPKFYTTCKTAGRKQKGSVLKRASTLSIILSTDKILYLPCLF